MNSNYTIIYIMVQLKENEVSVAVNYSRSKTEADKFGTVDLLVNNASITRHIAIDDLEAVTEEIWDALAPNIRVNCVVPGAVATRWWAGKVEQMKRLAPKLLLQRISTPEDIAQLICAALEQEAMTGQTITVDSGQTL
jgi:NAD(P)-dependent dehydrogenase (short-subunit alcohol dehydrogenase family)